MTNLRTYFDPIEPYTTGYMDTLDGHTVYYERCGKERGIPAVFLHGGPGGAISPHHRQLFDPQVYDVLLFDQRGCGRSTPHASIENNTTWHLVEDIERLRKIAGVERWTVVGGSWGSSLGLAYAQKYPERVSGLVLFGVYTLTKAELNWYYQFGVSEIFPEKWEAFQSPIPPHERGDMISAYRKLLICDDKVKRLEAAKAWSRWEAETITLIPREDISDKFQQDDYALAFARLENHFFMHDCWLEEGQLLRNATVMEKIPGAIIHGRYDMPCPARSAFELHKRWPNADFTLVEAAGHSMADPGILDHLVRAIESLSVLQVLGTR